MKIAASDTQAYDGYGCSVSVSGDYAIAGSCRESGGPGDPFFTAGAAYIFHRTGSNSWDGGTKIVASDPGMSDEFGWSVSISGDYVVAGAYHEDGAGNALSNAGAA